MLKANQQTPYFALRLLDCVSILSNPFTVIQVTIMYLHKIKVQCSVLYYRIYKII